MLDKFTKNVMPYVDEELLLARKAKELGLVKLEFQHLENAHVIGQESTFLHVKVHGLMLFWGYRNNSIKEVLGQALRIIGAATKTAMGLVPQGNTGGANVSPFKVMEIKPKHQNMINLAKRS
ncbi:DUF3703 domain-containing protein [Cognaticolwellia mytili]|uniref:DUF3703 domain-containing protein n=1 Tax=Cognaticolwellia mytili TaxID=1888913 RepID=UPI000A17562A|nr:DUF3703 domain-containing protein [Cognaticolwellia mytili]